MLEIEKLKLNNIKLLISKRQINSAMLIKLIHVEILKMKKTFTLKQILILLNSEFNVNIKYANLQRTMHRLQSTLVEKSALKYSSSIQQNNQSFTIDATIDDEDLI